MKETKLLERSYFPFCIFIICFFIINIYSCNRSELIPVGESDDFSIKVAKKWWASHFTKSAEYTSYNENSPLTPYKSNKRKFVAWSKAVYYRSGDFEFIEMPLQYDRKTVLMIGMQDIMGTPEASRIAKAALQRLLIIKAPDGSISVRIVTLVPSVEYARKHFYDLSGLSVNKLPSDFSGYKLIGKWDNSHVKTFRVVKGKLTKRINLKYLSPQEEAIAKQQNLIRSADGGTTMSATTQICHYEWVPIMVTVCVIVTDDPADTGVCEEHESGGTWEEVCEEGPPDPYEPPACEEWDYCCRYGLGCDDTPDDPVEPNEPDPCAEANQASINLTNLSKQAKYLEGKTAVQDAVANDPANNKKEHAVAFGKDANGNIIRSDVNTGTPNSGTIPSITNRFSDLHNHTDNKPPSSGDLYGFIDLAITNPNYMRYIITSNGTVYSLALINKQAAINFNSNYPRVPGVEVQNPDGTVTKYEPTFPQDLVDEYIDVKYYSGGSDEIATAFILSKYNSGVALLKQDANGNFKRLNTKEHTDANGNKTYTSNNCQ